MAVSRSSRRTRTPIAATENTNDAGKVGQVEGTMTEQIATGDTKAGKLDLAQKPESKAATAKAKSEIQVRTAGQIAERPVGADTFEIAETYSEAGIRPIGVSHLEVFGTILNGRPITASHLHVMDYALPGHRPVFADAMTFRDDLTLPGGRPVVTSSPKLLEASMLPGGRPIASNDVDDSETLMGFLD
ncbi:MAG: hypothetical protein KME11_06860 [Timaviella obliquedivisa GSE-PSE-MK23-08B]|jgi:hypothetical protein|nr:hypothetical protein [Timaviella obliquedivisa GSE-PSE-MK23-08B]